MIIGLTGSIGTGKSTVLEIFKRNNFIIFNSDKHVADLTLNNLEIINNIGLAFHNVVSNNIVNKQLLKNAIYINYLPNILKLEKIILPTIIKEINLFINNNKDKNLIIEAPLLFEYNLNKLCNYVIATYCSKNTQIQRVQQRNKLSPVIIKQIINKQIKIKDYKHLINFLINTDKPKAKVEQKVNLIIQKLLIS